VNFTSYTFLLLILPCAVILYWGLLKSGKNILAKMFLLAISLVFSAMSGTKTFAVFVICIAVNYAMAYLIRKYRSNAVSKLLLGVGITVDIVILIYCKYTNFFIDSVNLFTGKNLSHVYLIVPLGVSYYVFSLISYLTDVYNQKDAACSFLDYMIFVSWMPKFVEGPITYERDLVPKIQNLPKKPDYAQLSLGLQLLATGLVKKTILSDTLGKSVSYSYYRISSLSTMQAWLISIAYSFQLYFDFSGYCDMAIGISKFFGIDLPVNFNSPYKADSINDFWKRWHITLTAFLREYVYFPLGGSRKGKVRTYLNVIVVFLVSGFWHGAGLTFIIWGLMHGIASIIDRAWKDTIWCKLPLILRKSITFIFVDVAWVMFRAESLNDGIEFIRRMFTWHNGGFDWYCIESFVLPEWKLLELIPLFSCLTDCHFVAMGVFMVCAGYICFVSKNCYETMGKYTAKSAVITVLLLAVGIMSMTGLSQFIYAGF
jgi:alginate O-acetyltransferase complex protein AlgI